jgi:hypothetical protein
MAGGEIGHPPTGSALKKEPEKLCDTPKRALARGHRFHRLVRSFRVVTKWNPADQEALLARLFALPEQDPEIPLAREVFGG